jgi:uncharacterized protein (DUF1800 family)
MSASTKAEAVLALNRFGMGPRSGSIAVIEADPRGALIADLERTSADVPAASVPSSVEAFRKVAEANAKRQAQAVIAARALKESRQAKTSEGSSMMEGTDQDDKEKAAKAAVAAVPDPGRSMYLDEARIRIDAALAAEVGFVERLVWFWSNHFCISADKIRSMSGAYEREAIRPHVLGQFSDLLLTAEGHPAMLYYLDNVMSVGPQSIAGINQTRGLNENMAREVLELHTLGVRSGYGQDDVIRFANVLTGWTWVSAGASPEHGGEFTFNPRLHEPGAQKVIEKVYSQEGVEQGRAVLRDLAVHPATATHVATKLARHFVTDAPPTDLVESIATVFLNTQGDLKETAKAMIVHPASWTQPPTKLKRPSEWVVGIMRAGGLAQADPERFTRGQALLGEPLWRPPSPKGHPDDEASWIDGIGRRLDIANRFSERIADRVDPKEVIESVLGSSVSPEVSDAVSRAESRQQALALLFMATEFQRR